MNYLAHAYLSFNNPKLQFGNLIGDFVKGKRYLEYPKEIQNGIILHRFIDKTTDQNPLIHEAINFFKPHFRLSGGVFVDIILDHFLANDSSKFDSDDSLKRFTHSIYHNISKHEDFLSDEMKTYFGYMTQYNWLYNYKYSEGIEKSIIGICKRYPRLGDAEKALSIFESKYDQLQSIYVLFFEHLCTQARDKIDNL